MISEFGFNFVDTILIHYNLMKNDENGELKAEIEQSLIFVKASA